MNQYHKIQSIYKRDQETGRFIMGEFSRPEFAYLYNSLWTFDEKVDGTNMRVIWDGDNRVEIRGKSDEAQIYSPLLQVMVDMFPVSLMKLHFDGVPVTLYGEGYGARIQKGGGNYISNGVSFILFDVLIGGFWLERDDVDDVANKLSINSVPFVGMMTLKQAEERVISGFDSILAPNVIAEGIVGRPLVPLFNKKGERVIVKIKHRDYSSIT